MIEENDTNDILNRLSIKTLSTIKNENEENKYNTEEKEEKTKKYIKIFKQENDSKTLNLLPNDFNLKIMTPLATYHSKKIPFKNRNHSVKNSRSKIKNNSTQEINFFKKGGTINFKKLIREKINEKYSISNINFEFYPNKKKENFIICDTENLNNKSSRRNNFFEENFSDIHFKKEEENNIYEIIDDQTIEFNKNIENKENINSNIINYNLNNNELETDYSQTKSNSKQNSHKSKIRIGKRNIKKIILNERESSFSPNSIEKKPNDYQNNNYSSYFRKMNFQNTIKLPDFSWIYNKGNSNYKKKNHKKIIVKKNKNCLYKQNEINNNNFKFVDYNELYKIHKENDLNQINDKNSKKYFHQCEIYYKLTHSKDKKKSK